jgi:hypothetical protein
MSRRQRDTHFNLCESQGVGALRVRWTSMRNTACEEPKGIYRMDAVAE